jgi:hypothetical protein
MSDIVIKKKSVRGRKPKSIGEENKNISIKTYHFNMCDEMIHYIDYFATLHKNDDRKVFKEEWQKWIQTEVIANLFESETNRLKKEGYIGNIVDKLYHSARYYYRKKPNNENKDSEEKKRKKYELMDPTILNNIEKHILSQVREHIVDIKQVENKIITHCDISPANAYKKFLETNPDLSGDETYFAKLKKTYKNRFFVIRKKCSSTI